MRSFHTLVYDKFTTRPSGAEELLRSFLVGSGPVPRDERGVFCMAGEQAEAQVLKVLSRSAGVPVWYARTRYSSAWRAWSQLIGRLVGEGYPPEIRVLLPFYWIASRPEGWYVLGGVYGTECVPGRLHAYSSWEAADRALQLDHELNLEAVRALHPVQFTPQVVEDLRRLAAREALTPAV